MSMHREKLSSRKKNKDRSNRDLQIRAGTSIATFEPPRLGSRWRPLDTYHAWRNAEKSAVAQGTLSPRPALSNSDLEQQARTASLSALSGTEAGSSRFFERTGGTRAGQNGNFERTGSVEAGLSSLFERTGGTRAGQSGHFERTGGAKAGTEQPFRVFQQHPGRPERPF